LAIKVDDPDPMFGLKTLYKTVRISFGRFCLGLTFDNGFGYCAIFGWQLLSGFLGYVIWAALHIARMLFKRFVGFPFFWKPEKSLKCNLPNRISHQVGELGEYVSGWMDVCSQIA